MCVMHHDHPDTWRSCPTNLYMHEYDYYFFYINRRKKKLTSSSRTQKLLESRKPLVPGQNRECRGEARPSPIPLGKKQIYPPSSHIFFYLIFFNEHLLPSDPETHRLILFCFFTFALSKGRGISECSPQPEIDHVWFLIFFPLADLLHINTALCVQLCQIS